MNGIVTEAVYPSLAKVLDDLPIRVFYFDGTQGDLERDVGIFIELARTYQRRKRTTRRYPAYFGAEHCRRGLSGDGCCSTCSHARVRDSLRVLRRSNNGEGPLALVPWDSGPEPGGREVLCLPCRGGGGASRPGRRT